MEVIMFNPEKKYLVTQSNYLIDAKHSSTLQELRIVLTMISMVQPQDKDFKEYKIRIKDLSQLIGVKGQSMYGEIKKTLDKLMKRIIYIPNNDGFLMVHWVSSIEYHKGEGMVSLCFDPKLKPFLLNLKGNFTTEQLEILLTLSTPYSVRIYQILKKNEKIGKVKLDISDFREMLGIEDKKYPVFQDFKRWVINSAKKELETKYKESGTYKSDVTFELETVKEKRKTKYLIFHIKKQSYQSPLLLKFNDNDKKEESEVIKKLRNYGISQNDAVAFLNEQGEEQIEKCLTLFEDRLKKGIVKESISGYLAKMLREKAGEQSAYQLEEDKRRQQKQEAQEIKNKEQNKIEELKKEFNNYQKTKIEALISNLSQEEEEQLKIEFEEKGMTSTFEKQQYQKKGLKSVLINASYMRFLRNKYFSENEQDFIVWASEKGYSVELIQGTKNEYQFS